MPLIIYFLLNKYIINNIRMKSFSKIIRDSYILLEYLNHEHFETTFYLQLFCETSEKNETMKQKRQAVSLSNKDDRLSKRENAVQRTKPHHIYSSTKRKTGKEAHLIGQWDKETNNEHYNRRSIKACRHQDTTEPNADGCPE